MRVYQALRVRCGLFVHFVGRMQPVLALAREALRKPLRPAEAATVIEELDRTANRVNADETLANTFIESSAERLPTPDPPVTRQDLETVLGLLESNGGTVRAKKIKGQAAWKITGLDKRAVDVTVDRETLERDDGILPLTAGSDLVQRLVARLGLPSRLPLVVGEHHTGAFRCAEVRWINANGAVAVTSAKHLQKLLADWDGSPPSPTVLVATQQAVARAARQRAEEMKRASQSAEDANRKAQLEAARLRLLRELGRTLRCVGSGDLNALLKKQIEKESSSADRYHRALELLGGYPVWPADLLEEIAAFVNPLTPHDRQARVALPASLDAAINDPRWLATVNLPTGN
jgi:ribosomal protein L9